MTESNEQDEIAKAIKQQRNEIINKHNEMLKDPQYKKLYESAEKGDIVLTVSKDESKMETTNYEDMEDLSLAVFIREHSKSFGMVCEDDFVVVKFAKEIEDAASILANRLGNKKDE